MSAIWIKLHRAPNRPVVINASAALTIERTENGQTRIVFPETCEDADGVVLVTETVDEVCEKIAKGNGEWRWMWSFNPSSLAFPGLSPTGTGRAIAAPRAE
jgi:hypothetical protein